MSKSRPGQRAAPVRPIFDAPPATPAPPAVRAPPALPEPRPRSSIRKRVRQLVPLIVCTVLILQFFILSLIAVRQKNATWDENFHVLGAYCDLWLHDYRCDFDNFTLWKYWAALPLGPNGVKIHQEMVG